MAYTQRLNRLIEQSGLSVKEIAERCTEEGQSLTASYISILRNPENNRTPSDDISRAIAKVCLGQESDILVLENYLDQAPRKIIDILEGLKRMSLEMGIKEGKKYFSEEQLKQAEAIVNNMSLAEFVLDCELSFNDFQGVGESLQSYKVKDDSMFPLLTEKALAYVKPMPLEEYKNDDIVCFQEINADKITFRKIIFLNEKHTEFAMTPQNPKYKTKIYKVSDVILLGKVEQVVIDY